MLSKRKGYLLFSLMGTAYFFFCQTGKMLAEEGNIVWSRQLLLQQLGLSLLAGTLAGIAVCSVFYYLGASSSAEYKGKKDFAQRQEGVPSSKSAPRQTGGFASRLIGRPAPRQTSRPAPRLISRPALRLSGRPAPRLIGRPAPRQTGRSASRLPGPGGCFLGSWLLIFLAWLPGFLAYYPAVCSYDITVQTGQIVFHAYNDHHPIAHTLLLEGFMRLGEALGQVNTGIALYALVQMLCLAAAFAAGVGLLRAWEANVLWTAALVLYGMFFPFHMYMSVSVTKDTVFTVFFFLLLLALYGCIREKRNSLRPGRWDAVYFASSVGMILMRTNGRYALLVLLFFLLSAVLFSRKEKKEFLRLSVTGLLALAAGSLLLTGLFRLTDAEQGDRREMLSMPIQQMSRAMIYHGGAGVLPEDDNTMEERDKALINDFILDEAYRKYRPDISDPVKSHTNTYVFRYRAKEFLDTYLRLLTRYPGDYVNAALAVNAGYLRPGDVSHAYINTGSGERGMGYIQTRWVEEELNPRGIYKASKWPWLYERLEEYADGNAYLAVPVLKYLFVPGSYLWLWLLLAGWLLLQRRYRLLLPLSLVLGYYLTLFLGPTVQLRYLYPVMVFLPFCFGLRNLRCGSSKASDPGHM